MEWGLVMFIGASAVCSIAFLSREDHENFWLLYGGFERVP